MVGMRSPIAGSFARIGRLANRIPGTSEGSSEQWADTTGSELTRERGSPMTAVRTTFTTMGEAVARRRAMRAEQRRLERELAEYRSPAERHELDAILSRHTAEEIAPIERIVLRQARPGGLAYHV